MAISAIHMHDHSYDAMFSNNHNSRKDGKCSVREFTCYKSSKLKIISNPNEQRHLKKVVVFKPDWDGSKFQDILDG